MSETANVTVVAQGHEEFHRQVRAFVAGYRGPRCYFDHGDGAEARVAPLYAALGERGWLSLTWPEQFGGAGRPASEELVLWDEMAYARIARPPLAAGIVAHSIILHGTPEQHQRFLPGIRAGSTTFCLGLSEPEAGSDLSAVRTSAVLDGEVYRVNGEKRWTSMAHGSRHIWLLCRTGNPDDRTRSLSFLLVDLTSPGVTISPIPTLDDGRLNEVRFDDVVVPAQDRLGDEGAGWEVLTRSLVVERHLEFTPGRVRRDLDDVIGWLGGLGRLGEPDVRRRLAGLVVRLRQVEGLTLAVLAELEAGRPAVVEAACSKLAGSELAQAIARTALDLAGPEGVAAGTVPEYLWRQSISETVGGGTSEMMRNTIARMGLHLGAGR